MLSTINQFITFKIAALKMVSMGQGQEIIARKMMSDCMSAGGWVLLQNVHLSLPFCSEIIDILVETEHVEESFRLWVTTEVHEEFPIGLLQMAIKFTNEPPQGIRASLKRSYQVIILKPLKTIHLFMLEFNFDSVHWHIMFRLLQSSAIVSFYYRQLN